MKINTLEGHIESVSGACFAAAAVIRHLAEEYSCPDTFKIAFREVAINAEDAAAALLEAFLAEDKANSEGAEG